MGQLPTIEADFKDVVYTTNRISNNYYNHIHQRKLSMMIPSAREQLTFAMMTIYLEAQSGLRESIDEAVLRYIAHGLQMKSMRDHGDAANAHRKDGRIPQQLTLNKMLGVFIIGSVIYVLASIVFVFEVILGHKHAYANEC